VVHVPRPLEECSLKIGIVTQSYYPKPGGVTEVVHHTANGLRRLGHEVIIITTRYNGREKDDPGIYRIGRNMLVPVNGALVNVTIGFGLRKKLQHIFHREDFDIIQTHCPLVPTLPLLTLKAARKNQKVVGTFHATAQSNIAYHLFKRPLEARATRLNRRIAVSASAHQFAHKYFPSRYDIVPNGIDCDRFHPDVAPIEELTDGRLNILYVGRMDARKGVTYLLRALPLAQKRLRQKIRLILVGEGKLRGFLIRRPVILHGAEIIAVGRIEPHLLPRYYTSADIFCSPATGQESFGIVLLEAMASGIPIVASEIPGYRTVVTSGKEGFLVPPRDPERFAAAIAELGNEPALRRTFGTQGREKALMYNWPIIVGLLERLFYETLGREVDNRTQEPVYESTE